MQQLVINLYGPKSAGEIQTLRSLFNLLLSELSPTELQKVERKLRQNPQMLKNALKFI